jgi:hypothetical protein
MQTAFGILVDSRHHHGDFNGTDEEVVHCQAGMRTDLEPARQWGERFPLQETAFAAETPPAREVLTNSRTM